MQHNTLELIETYKDFRIYKDNGKCCYCIGTRFKVLFNYFYNVEDCKEFIQDIYNNPIRYLKDLIS